MGWGCERHHRSPFGMRRYQARAGNLASTQRLNQRGQMFNRMVLPCFLYKLRKYAKKPILQQYYPALAEILTVNPVTDTTSAIFPEFYAIPRRPVHFLFPAQSQT